MTNRPVSFWHTSEKTTINEGGLTLGPRPEKLTPEDEVKINAFATRWFRNQADRDYVVARMCYRNRLGNNFHWSSLQAIEKYFKAMFLYHRVCVNWISHDLSALIDRIPELPFEVDLTEISMHFISHIDAFGMNRYLERPYFIDGPKLIELDRCIWEIRRFCRVWNSAYTREPDGIVSELERELGEAQKADPKYPRLIRLSGGYLEELLNKKEHPARSQLIWQNAFFSPRKRHSVKMVEYSEMENPPQVLYPEIVKHVQKYVKVPKELKHGG